jgi:PAS domain S-box-containing protein
MNLRVKLLLGIGIALIVTFALVAVFSLISMEKSYRTLEETEVISAVSRAEISLETDEKNLRSVTRDYAAWTDTYRFAQGQNPAWVETNTGNDFFVRFGLQGAMIFNRSGGLVFAKGYNESLKNATDIPDTLVTQISAISTSPEFLDSGTGSYTILDEGSGPVIVSSHPILTDNFDGPSAGSFHVVRRIDKRYLADLSSRAQNTVEIVPSPLISGNTTVAGILTGITPGHPVMVVAENADTIAGYAPLEKLHDPGRYYLKVSEPRTIYQSGQATILTFILSLLGAGVFIIVFVLLFIDRIVLSRLNTIISTVRRNKETGDGNIGNGDSNTDELTRLALEIDPVFTDLASSRAQLQQSEERYRMLAESAQDFIYIIDTEDRVTYVNSFAAAAVRKSKDEIVGKPRSALFPEPENERQGQNIKKVLTTGQPLKIESNLPLPTGDMWNDTLLVPLRDRNSRIAGVLGITRDITQRKRAEEALHQANKKLNLLSSITRHDILNQLTALRTYFEISHDYLQDEEMKDLIGKEEKIAEVIDRQIMFTRDYQQMGVHAPAWQTMDTIITTTILSFDTSHVKIVSECPGLEIFADPLLEKVFYNLFENAFRYGGANLSRICVSCEETGDRLILRIEDNGVGVPEENKPKVFERGFGNHTGLGLFLSREILGITGMAITETGIPGRGACFEIRIPKGTYRFAMRGEKAG